MADLSEKQRAKKGGIGRPFQKGQTGNATGRPKGWGEFREKCREYTEDSLRALHEALSDDKLKVQAAQVILSYGWGKPPSAPEDLEAVAQAGDAEVLNQLTVNQLVAIAKGEKPPDET